ncbi:MAG: hypothetical protein ACRDPZ_12650 [Gaiellaceae bacterium]
MSTAKRGGRQPLVLAKGVKNTLAGSGLTRAKKGAQRHVLVSGETRTLCGIDTQSWQEAVVEPDALVTCPLCAQAVKEAARASKEATS